MIYEIDNDQDEKLNDALVQEFSHKLESTINEIIGEHLDKDTRLELLTTLISFAAQISQDLCISAEKFVEISTEFYQEAEIATDAEYFNDLTKKSNALLN